MFVKPLLKSRALCNRLERTFDEGLLARIIINASPQLMNRNNNFNNNSQIRSGISSMPSLPTFEEKCKFQWGNTDRCCSEWPEAIFGIVEKVGWLSLNLSLLNIGRSSMTSGKIDADKKVVQNHIAQPKTRHGKDENPQIVYFRFWLRASDEDLVYLVSRESSQFFSPLSLSLVKINYGIHAWES